MDTLVCLERSLGALALGDCTATHGVATTTTTASETATASTTTAAAITETTTTTAEATTATTAIATESTTSSASSTIAKATTATAEATTAKATAATAASAAVVARLRVVEAKVTTLKVVTLELVERLGRGCLVAELDVTEALGRAAFAVGGQPDIDNLAVLAKELVDAVLIGGEGQVSYKEDEGGWADGVVEDLCALLRVGGAGLRVVEVDGTSVDLLALELGHGLDGGGYVGELDVAEAARPASCTVDLEGE